jgi:penicillin amidase
LLALNTAATPEDITAAAALIAAPAQSILFATTTGDIGFQAAGLIPVRASAAADNYGYVGEELIPLNGTWPQDGRHTEKGWAGFIPSEDMPRALNPESGFLVAANQAVLPTGQGPFLGMDYDYGFRAARITEMIRGVIDTGQVLTPGHMSAIQFDAYNPAATVLVRTLQEIDLPTDWQAAGQRLLADWDHTMDAHSSAAAYFAATWNHILQLTFWDELPEGVRPDGTSRWLVVVRDILYQPNDPFWDDRSTLNVVESRDEILRTALIAARNELTTRVSSNTEDWHWGALHLTKLENPVLGGSTRPRLQRWYANPQALPTSGSTLSVNATAWPAGTTDMDVMTGPVFRVVMDMGDFEGSTWVNMPGNSGHVGAHHYDDQLEAWVRGDQFRFYFRSPAHHALFASFIPAQ